MQEKIIIWIIINIILFPILLPYKGNGKSRGTRDFFVKVRNNEGLSPYLIHKLKLVIKVSIAKTPS
jgi:hypothetical protein